MHPAGIPLATRYVLSPVPHPQPHASSAPATPSASPTRTVATPRKQLSGWTSTTRMPWVRLVVRNRAPLSVPAHCSGCRCLWPWSACRLPRRRPRRHRRHRRRPHCPRHPHPRPRRRPRNRPQPLASAAPRASAGRMVVATHHMPSQGQVAGRHPVAPAPHPALTGPEPTSTPRRPRGPRATSSCSPTTAPRAPPLARASAPWPSTTTCTAPTWASST